MSSLVPYMSDGEIRGHARALLDAHHAAGTIPVPIDVIAEVELGLEIIPIPGILDSRGINGYLTSDRRAIYVDERLFRVAETRYLFTIAHEIAHLRMHQDYFPVFKSDDEWLAFRAGLTAESLGTAEFQANTFAGLVLVPETVLPGVVEESFGRLAARVKEQYGDFDFASDAFWDQVAEDIKGRFRVAHDTARICLQNDGFWGKVLGKG